MINIKEIAQIIAKNNGRLYLVGGAVRDKLFNIANHDEDYCVVGMDYKKFEELFPTAIKKGKSFLVYEIDKREFAMARAEKKIGINHRDFEIISNRNITIEEDLARRDITINSIAEDVLTGELIDPFNGIEDFKNRTIRATSSSFSEDALRAYRAARFACKFNFEIDDSTYELIGALKGDLKYLSSERVFEELRKALNTEHPEKFFKVLKRANILDVHFIEIYKLIGAVQPTEHHPEGDAYNHTMLALKMAASITKNEEIRFSALVHDLGKGLTPKEAYPHHYGHDIKGKGEVIKLGERLKMPKSWISCGVTAATEHMLGGIFYKMKPSKQVDFIERVSKTRLGLKGLEIVVESDRNCRGTRKEHVEFAEIGKELLSKINGKSILKKFPNITEGIQLKNKIHQERVEYLKEIKEL
ncbi:MAG: HD domain-containing protein [Clostridia bacterium]|nr:HD domain-containing protein [Clostridia bacterium]